MMILYFTDMFFLGRRRDRRARVCLIIAINRQLFVACFLHDRRVQAISMLSWGFGGRNEGLGVGRKGRA